MANDTDPPNRIRELREARGIDGATLASLVHADPSTITKLEKGQRGLDLNWLFRIAEVLECEPADLLPRSANRYLLDDEERALIEARRAASDRDRDTFDRVAEGVLRFDYQRKPDAA